MGADIGDGTQEPLILSVWNNSVLVSFAGNRFRTAGEVAAANRILNDPGNQFMPPADDDVRPDFVVGE